MKAIIPVAGAGTNLRPHTFTQPKPLIPVAGKPIISFILDDLIAAGVDDIIFIIGYMGDRIISYVNENYKNIKVTFVRQEERRGLGHAISIAKEEFRSSKEILIVLGDTIVDIDFKQLINSSNTCLGIKKVEDPRQFGVVEMGESGFVRRVVEKPSIPKSNLAMVGIYKIKEVDQLIKALEYHLDNKILTKGEYQLTDALMLMIKNGVRMVPLEVNNWFDCGKREILLETNSILLKRQKNGHHLNNHFEKTILIEPVFIGKNCQISNSIIGPNVTIGNGTKVNYSIIKESIIGNYSNLDEVMLHHSIVGHDASISGLRQSLDIGDNTNIDYSS